TLQQARQQVLRPGHGPKWTVLAAVGSGTLPKLGLARFDALPKVLIHNTKLGDVVNNPFALRVEAGDAPARPGALQVSESIPNEPPDIELVIKNACSTKGIAVDRGGAPRHVGW